MNLLIQIRKCEIEGYCSFTSYHSHLGQIEVISATKSRCYALYTTTRLMGLLYAFNSICGVTVLTNNVLQVNRTKKITYTVLEPVNFRDELCNDPLWTTSVTYCSEAPNFKDGMTRNQEIKWKTKRRCCRRIIVRNLTMITRQRFPWRRSSFVERPTSDLKTDWKGDQVTWYMSWPVCLRCKSHRRQQWSVLSVREMINVESEVN